jgi:hypothetical protein
MNRALQILIGTAAGAAVGIGAGLALHHSPPARPPACVRPLPVPASSGPLASFTPPVVGRPVCP